MHQIPATEDHIQQVSLNQQVSQITLGSRSSYRCARCMRIYLLLPTEPDLSSVVDSSGQTEPDSVARQGGSFLRRMRDRSYPHAHCALFQLVLCIQQRALRQRSLVDLGEQLLARHLEILQVLFRLLQNALPVLGYMTDRGSANLCQASKV